MVESHPQNPEFRNNPENFYPWIKCSAQGLLSMWTYMSEFIVMSQTVTWVTLVFIGIKLEIHHPPL